MSLDKEGMQGTEMESLEVGELEDQGETWVGKGREEKGTHHKVHMKPLLLAVPWPLWASSKKSSGFWETS